MHNMACHDGAMLRERQIAMFHVSLMLPTQHGDDPEPCGRCVASQRAGEL